MDSSPEKLSAQACASHELASVQQGIWLDQIAHPELPYYNIGMSLDIRGEINIPLFEKAIQMVVDSHDALRLSFSHADGFGRQQVLPEVRFTLEVVDFSEADDDAGLAMDYLRKSFQQPFESLNGQLWESRLVRCGPHHYYWFNRFHHLVVDGIGAVLVGHAVDNAYNGLLVGNEDVPEGLPTCRSSKKTELICNRVATSATACSGSKPTHNSRRHCCNAEPTSRLALPTCWLPVPRFRPCCPGPSTVPSRSLPANAVCPWRIYWSA